MVSVSVRTHVFLETWIFWGEASSDPTREGTVTSVLVPVWLEKGLWWGEGGLPA